MTTKTTDVCPLCNSPCPIETDDDAAMVECLSCYTFRITQSAVEKLANLPYAHHCALMLDVWQAHLAGKVLSITLADGSDYKVFERVRVEA